MNTTDIPTNSTALAVTKTKTRKTVENAADRLCEAIARAGNMYGRYLGVDYLWDYETGRLYLLSDAEEIARFVLRHKLLRYSKMRFWQIVELAAEKLRQSSTPMETDFAAFMHCAGPGMDGKPVTREQVTPWLSAAFRCWYKY